MRTEYTIQTSNPNRLKTQGQAESGTQTKPNTLYRIGWRRGDKTGIENDIYTSFISAVRMADGMQQAVNDSPISAQFHVTDSTGKMVYQAE